MSIINTPKPQGRPPDIDAQVQEYLKRKDPRVPTGQKSKTLKTKEGSLPTGSGTYHWKKEV